MLRIISQNIINYGIEIPDDTILRINLAWINDLQTLKNIIEHDKNIICVGFAMDALTRLANYNKQQSDLLPPIHDLRSELLKILGKSPIRCWESLGRSGLTEKHLSKFPESG